MKIFLSALIATLTPLAASSAQDVPDNMDLFLLIGQSNMAGRGKIEAADNTTNPRIYMLTKDLHWVLARDPLHFDKPEAGVGPGSEFARVLAARDSTVAIGLIPCAMGGSSLDQWKAGGQLYTNAVARAREAMKRGKLRGILWHQGESDSSHDKASTYVVRFTEMIGHLRTDLDASTVPLIIGELGRFHSENAEINKILPTIPAQIPLCAFVNSEGLTDRGDQLHFDTASARILGQRYAEAYLKLIASPAETPATPPAAAITTTESAPAR